MPGNVSFVTLYDGRRFTVERKQGDRWLRILHGLEEAPSEAYGDKLLDVKSIYPELRTATDDPLDAQSRYWNELDAKNQQAASQAESLKTKMTNPGILQGLSEQIPRGDR